jgi:hypothetical protein
MRNLATALVALGAAIPRAAGQEAAPAEPAKPAEVEEKSLSSPTRTAAST